MLRAVISFWWAACTFSPHLLILIRNDGCFLFKSHGLLILLNHILLTFIINRVILCVCHEPMQVILMVLCRWVLMPVNAALGIKFIFLYKLVIILPLMIQSLISVLKLFIFWYLCMKVINSVLMVTCHGQDMVFYTIAMICLRFFATVRAHRHLYLMLLHLNKSLKVSV